MIVLVRRRFSREKATPASILCLDSFSQQKPWMKLFLTLSPQIADRAARTNRPGIVQGLELRQPVRRGINFFSLRQRVPLVSALPMEAFGHIAMVGFSLPKL
jgi:hypothetical protein